MDREAYPTGFRGAPKPPFDLKKWKETSIKVKMAARLYKDYTMDKLIDHFTQKWDFQEQNSFKDWWRLTQTNKRGQHNMSMEKTAYDYNAANQEGQLNELKKKLRSRINSAERLLNKMIDEGLLAGSNDKALYIGRILQKLKEEVNLLNRPQLMEARHNRANGIFRKAGLVEIADIMAGSVSIIASFGKTPLTKKAAEEEVASGNLGSIMEMIKEELDAFNYGVHLDNMMKIRGHLIALGRNSEADTILDIIKKELDDIDGIHKKLVEVYTSLGQVPRQRKQVSKPRELPIRPEGRPGMSAPPVPTQPRV
jgi:hypothetical protein